MKLPSSKSRRVMSIFTSTNMDDPIRFAAFGKGFAAAAMQYVATMKQEDAGKLYRVSSALAGVGTGAAITVMSLALLQIIGG